MAADILGNIGVAYASFAFDEASVDKAVADLEKKIQAAVKNATKGLDIDLKIDENTISKRLEVAVQNAAKKMATVGLPVQTKVAEVAKPATQSVNVQPAVEAAKKIAVETAKANQELGEQLSLFDKISVSSSNASEKQVEGLKKVEAALDQVDQKVDKVQDNIAEPTNAESVYEQLRSSLLDAKNISPEDADKMAEMFVNSNDGINRLGGDITKVKAQWEDVGDEFEKVMSVAITSIEKTDNAVKTHTTNVRYLAEALEDGGVQWNQQISGTTTVDYGAAEREKAKATRLAEKETAKQAAAADKERAAAIRAVDRELDRMIADEMTVQQITDNVHKVEREINTVLAKRHDLTKAGIESDESASLNDILAQYNELKTKVSEGNIGNTDFAQALNSIKLSYSAINGELNGQLKTTKELNAITDKEASDQKKAYEELVRLRQQEYELEAKSRKARSEGATDDYANQRLVIQQQANVAQAEYERLTNQTAKAVEAQLNAETKIIAAKASIKELDQQEEDTTNNQRLGLEKINAQAYKLLNNLNRVKAPAKDIQRVTDFIEENIVTMGKANLDPKTVARVKKEFTALNNELEKSNALQETLGNKITRVFKEKFGYAVMAALANEARKAIRQVYTNVVELDTAMTELRKVTDETASTYSRFLDTAAASVRSLGVSMTDLVNATADFARLGYNLSDATNLAEVATVYKHVGDGIADIGEASESIISTMKAFGIEASNAMEIVDKFNITGNNFAISSAGVGEALQRSASSLAVANNTLDESIALITAANTVVQNPETVGTAMKTLTARLRAAKTELEDFGGDTEGMANSISEIRKEMLALTGGAVDVLKDENTFKSTYDILRELSQVWDDLNDTSRANILEIVAGIRLPERTEMCA